MEIWMLYSKNKLIIKSKNHFCCYLEREKFGYMVERSSKDEKPTS